MRRLPLFLLVLCATYSSARASLLCNDQEAYNYCITRPYSFVAIVWPIAQGKDKEIEFILNTYGTIRYRKDMYLSAQQAALLLQKSHPSVPFILKRAHFRWYFPPGTLKNKARIFVVKFHDAATAVSCKQAIRSIFDLQYRSIHINDTHEETVEMAKFFFM